MPRLNDDTLEVLKVKGTNFQYSAARLETLGATEYTLVTIITDVSGSVAGFKDDLEKCLKEITMACSKSPRADNLLLRLLTFNSRVDEVHGYKLLMNCNPDDYNGVLRCGGNTALYDASYNGIEAALAYGKTLTDNDFAVNAIIFVMTDGDDNDSTYLAKHVKESLDKAMKNESLESLVSILIGVNVKDPHMLQYLEDFKKEAGFTQFVAIDEATKNKLAKLAEFVSKSISSQSQSLGSGGPSKPISLTI